MLAQGPSWNRALSPGQIEGGGDIANEAIKRQHLLKAKRYNDALVARSHDGASRWQNHRSTPGAPDLVTKSVTTDMPKLV